MFNTPAPHARFAAVAAADLGSGPRSRHDPTSERPERVRPVRRDPAPNEWRTPVKHRCWEAIHFERNDFVSPLRFPQN
eukprot:7007286-Prymnesium_polylepis.1